MVNMLKYVIGSCAQLCKPKGDILPSNLQRLLMIIILFYMLYKYLFFYNIVWKLILFLLFILLTGISPLYIYLFVCLFYNIGFGKGAFPHTPYLPVSYNKKNCKSVK